LQQADRLMTSLAFSVALKEGFNGDGALVSYLNIVCTTKVTTVKTCGNGISLRVHALQHPTIVQIVNDTRSRDMNDHDEWISCSHWGMFRVRAFNNIAAVETI
jgi:hypothetical protein